MPFTVEHTGHLNSYVGIIGLEHRDTKYAATSALDAMDVWRQVIRNPDDFVHGGFLFHPAIKLDSF